MLNSSLNINIFRVLNITIADPAVATAFSFTNPSTVRLRIIGISYQLVTDGNAANRVGTFHLLAAGNESMHHAQLSPQVASGTRITSWINFGAAGFQANVAARIISPLSAELYMNPSEVLVFAINSIQAGDQITNIVIRALEWIEV